MLHNFDFHCNQFVYKLNSQTSIMKFVLLNSMDLGTNNIAWLSCNENSKNKIMFFLNTVIIVI